MKAMKQIFLITDMGPGDGGKGGAVHKVCCAKNAHTVIKVGGAQGSHGVRTSNGNKFNFSQFGCGTFEGVMTHVTDLMVVNPIEFLDEGDDLVYLCGVHEAYDLITVDSGALCSTPFHRIASQLRELSRKGNPRGTIGSGVGAAFHDAELHPELAIRVGDICRTDLCDKLESVRQQKLIELAPIIENVGDLLPADQVIAREQISLLKEERYSIWIAGRFREMAQRIKVVGSDYLETDILSRDGVVVVESSHGVLTDRYHGFHPHTSKLRTVPKGTLDMLARCEYDGEIVRLGVTRAFQIRHGAGPMVTEDPRLLGSLLPGSHKAENRWQGKVRVGALDLVALRYSINVCGGSGAFQGLVVTWFDQVEKFGLWEVCDSYTGADDPQFFTPQGEIKVSIGNDRAQLDHQERLGQALRRCHPNLTTYRLPAQTSREALIDLCTGVIEKSLGIPVCMMSFGPTEDDKVCL